MGLREVLSKMKIVEMEGEEAPAPLPQAAPLPSGGTPGLTGPGLAAGAPMPGHLGVPGSPTAAVLLGGLLIWGLQPGPLLFQEQKEFVWGLIASMYLGNIAGLIVVLTCVPLFAAILRVPFSIIAPVIIVICAIGAYTVHTSMFDVYLMLVFGVAGYLMRKLNYPLAPLVLALVLGDRAEDSFRQSMLVSQGDLSVFFSNALVGGLTGLALVMLFWPLITAGLARIKAA
jgi:putative tricarboxylic transport membrane protein